VSAFLMTPHFREPADLIQALLHDLTLPHTGGSEEELRLRLTEHLLSSYQKHQRVVFVIDEGQNLAPAVLEELRLLGNLEGKKGKAAQVVILGLPAIDETLRLPNLAAFRQRLGARAVLEPLDVHEAADYLVHQIRRLGLRPEEMIDAEALGILAGACAGVPRLLNRATHKAVVLAADAEMKQIDAEVALEAVTALGLTLTEELESDLDTEEPASEESPAREGSRAHRLFAAPKRPA
jgi:type II secretory pathway predicted ATPase ExeA